MISTFLNFTFDLALHKTFYELNNFNKLNHTYNCFYVIRLILFIKFPYVLLHDTYIKRKTDAYYCILHRVAMPHDRIVELVVLER